MIRLLIVVGCVLGFVVGPQTAAAQATVKAPAKKLQNHYAMLIGVNKYAPPLSELRFCHADMAALRDHFIAAGYPEDHICFMEDDAEKTWLRPTRSNILTQAENWLNSMGKDDVIVLAFSGHGVQLRVNEGGEERDVSYLCPADSNIDKPADSMVSVQDIYRLMNNSPAAQRLLLIDACRNELTTGTRAAANIKGYGNEPPPKGVIIMSSCSKTQYSTEDPSLKHGVFMHYLLEGLQGSADVEVQGNSNGIITLTEIFEYTYTKTKTHVLNKHGMSQLPMLGGEFAGGIELAYVPDAAQRADLIRNELDRGKPASSQPTSTPNVPAVSLPAMATAHAYYRSADYSNAIEAYTAIIQDVDLPKEARDEARKGRAAAYASRGGKGDIDKALIDSQAVGKSGVSVVVKVAGELKLGTKSMGKVTPGQLVVITQPVTAGGVEFVYVASVNDNDAMKGYLKKSALITPAPTPVAVAPAPTTTRSVQPTPSTAPRPQTRPESNTSSDSEPNYSKMTPAQRAQAAERLKYEKAAEQWENGTWTLGSGLRAAQQEINAKARAQRQEGKAGKKGRP